ncbi:unnamed protein product, partial [Polarella glacialis]
AEDSFFIFWCHSSGYDVTHRRWGVAAGKDWEAVKQGDCKVFARAPEDHDVLDPIVTGWEELISDAWTVREDAGVSRLDLQEG